jgi:hypothetical protein
MADPRCSEIVPDVMRVSWLGSEVCSLVLGIGVCSEVAEGSWVGNGGRWLVVGDTDGCVLSTEVEIEVDVGPIS